MTPSTLRQLLNNTLGLAYNRWVDEVDDEIGRSIGFNSDHYLLVRYQTDALLACPELAAIIDLAAWYARALDKHDPLSPEVRALLADWRATR